MVLTTGAPGAELEHVPAGEAARIDHVAALTVQQLARRQSPDRALS